MEKIIITVVGKDQTGIIAKVTTYLSENNINILEISQNIVSGYFYMIVIADPEKCEKSADVLGDEMKKLGNEMGLVINVQREGIFTAMHRI
ncbi:MAG: ACT domain-containing protein [Eubacteriales bacterium]|nr:ACT domain-containing protein [Eubacteriales bacterium]